MAAINAGGHGRAAPDPGFQLNRFGLGSPPHFIGPPVLGTAASFELPLHTKAVQVEGVGPVLPPGIELPRRHAPGPADHLQQQPRGQHLHAELLSEPTTVRRLGAKIGDQLEFNLVRDFGCGSLHQYLSAGSESLAHQQSDQATRLHPADVRRAAHPNVWLPLWAAAHSAAVCFWEAKPLERAEKTRNPNYIQITGDPLVKR